ncbi:MAG TPA: hypothetical protein VFU37_24530 [Pyrinomonadaceae bacterium]|nr:hypothetical protein [Pyrinomonadaceae bacterium]
MKRRTMRAVASGLLLGAVITVFAARPHAQEERQDKPIIPENYFPDGEARGLIFQACVQCHDLRNTVSQRKSDAGWKRTVDEMIWRGAPLIADEAETVTRYLTVSFGPDKPIPPELQKNSTSKKR